VSEQAQKEIVPWTDYITKVQPRFEAIAKDNNQAVKWREESYFALQALKGNHYLAKSAPDTVQNAIINVAAVGLTLNPADGYAYLVPEFAKETKQIECQLRISFKGLIKSATDTGSIAWVRAEVVKENDKFEYKGPCTHPDHAMDAFGDRGKSVGVYCIAKTNEGDYLVDIMPWGEVLKIKECAKTKKVWDQWPDEMAKKAIIKRAAKQWPKTERSGVLHKAIEVINDAEGSDYIKPYTEEDQEKFNQLIEANDALGYRLFWLSLSEDARDALFSNHVQSIQKGQGRMAAKEVIRNLEATGHEILEQARYAIAENEHSLLAECLEDTLEITADLLMETLNESEQSTFREMTEVK